jgi:hypothetical protein
MAPTDPCSIAGGCRVALRVGVNDHDFPPRANATSVEPAKAVRCAALRCGRAGGVTHNRVGTRRAAPRGADAAQPRYAAPIGRPQRLNYRRRTDGADRSALCTASRNGAQPHGRRRRPQLALNDTRAILGAIYSNPMGALSSCRPPLLPAHRRWQALPRDCAD